jgi:hypothetical protein
MVFKRNYNRKKKRQETRKERVRRGLHPPKHRRQNARLACARTEHYSANNAKIRRATVEEDRTTQAPSQMHLPKTNHVPHPKPQRQHTPLACPHRVLLRITLDQTDRRTGPERPDIAPTPSRRKQPRHCLQGRARPHDLYNSHYKNACYSKVLACKVLVRACSLSTCPSGAVSFSSVI